MSNGKVAKNRWLWLARLHGVHQIRRLAVELLTRVTSRIVSHQPDLVSHQQHTNIVATLAYTNC